MADFMSSPERKNPLGSLEAYVRSACCDKNDVYFVLKTINTHIRPDIERKLKQFRDNHPSIILMEGYLSRAEVNALFNCCDCFVSLHRAEGFGLPLAEAMCLGKPVIATGWSGNTDFMNVGNSLPVRYTIVPLDRDSGPYRKGFHWAEPDLKHAAELMDVAARDKSLVCRIGMQARHDIMTHFSPETVGRLMDQRLNRIYQWLCRSDNQQPDASSQM
jgi:glycosyltransferase involved in cell wall biosynthesis